MFHAYINKGYVLSAAKHLSVRADGPDQRVSAAHNRDASGAHGSRLRRAAKLHAHKRMRLSRQQN